MPSRAALMRMRTSSVQSAFSSSTVASLRVVPVPEMRVPSWMIPTTTGI